MILRGDEFRPAWGQADYFQRVLLQVSLLHVTTGIDVEAIVMQSPIIRTTAVVGAGAFMVAGIGTKSHERATGVDNTPDAKSPVQIGCIYQLLGMQAVASSWW